MDEKIVTILINGYPRRCSESDVPKALESIEKLKAEYLQKGIPQETIDKLYSPIEIVGDEDLLKSEERS